MTDLPGGLISDSDDDGSDDDGSMDGGMDTRLRVLLTVALLSIIVGGTADLLTDDLEFWLSVHAAAAWSAGC